MSSEKDASWHQEKAAQLTHIIYDRLKDYRGTAKARDSEVQSYLAWKKKKKEEEEAEAEEERLKKIQQYNEQLRLLREQLEQYREMCRILEASASKRKEKDLEARKITSQTEILRLGNPTTRPKEIADSDLAIYFDVETDCATLISQVDKEIGPEKSSKDSPVKSTDGPSR